MCQLDLLDSASHGPLRRVRLGLRPQIETSAVRLLVHTRAGLDDETVKHLRSGVHSRRDRDIRDQVGAENSSAPLGPYVLAPIVHEN